MTNARCATELFSGEAPTSDDATRLRGALRAFATGVTVVTSSGEETPYGVTANAFTSVSLIPPLVLVCLSSASSAVRTIARNRAFAVNILSADQEWLARRFACRTRPRGSGTFRGVPHRTESTGAPILEGVSGWLDCRLDGLQVVGDHVLAIGEVLDFGGGPRREPLVFHAGRYRGVHDRDGSAPASLPTSDSPERR